MKCWKLLAAGALMMVPAMASAVTISGNSGWSYGPAYTPMTNDLANAGSPALVSAVFDPPAYNFGGNPATLNDGIYVTHTYTNSPDPDASFTDDGLQAFNGDANFGSIATYTVTFNGGYDLTNINVMSASTIYAISKQNYKMEVAHPGDTTWTTIYESLPDLGVQNRSGPIANAVTTAFAAGEATNIDRVRLTFLQPPMDSFSDPWTATGPFTSTVYREVDIVGAATSVPEPASLGLLVLGAFAATRRRTVDR